MKLINKDLWIEEVKSRCLPDEIRKFETTLFCNWKSTTHGYDVVYESLEEYYEFQKLCENYDSEEGKQAFQDYINALEYVEDLNGLCVIASRTPWKNVGGFEYLNVLALASNSNVALGINGRLGQIIYEDRYNGYSRKSKLKTEPNEMGD